MDHDTISFLFWLALVVSIALTITGIGMQKPDMLFIAAGIAFPLAVLALLSIGVIILLVGIFQLSIGIAMRRTQQGKQQL